ncbi:MAG: metal-dependent hydrolase [Dehalococcoidia bacterium]|nr:MAG: metal-dependent hydrolase [Dehalococcoidia bacterium]
MLGRTHILAGLTAGLIVSRYTGQGGELITMGVAAAAALLPDIDSSKSMISRNVPVAPWVLENTMGHRGAMHSIAGALAVSLLISFLLRQWYPAAIIQSMIPAFMAGYLSHLVLDTLTNSGVPWLWPLPLRIRLPLAQTGGLLERTVVMPALVLVFLVLISSFWRGLFW